MMYVKALNECLHACFRSDPRVVLLGEDIADPYGGAFKVTRGLSSAFAGRVFSTPISEAAIVGVAAGLALSGYRPIVEIMFGDFTTLCFDQIVNHIAKYPAMYNGQASCPVIIRTPMGGHRGYGPTHSQCLEKHFFGVPGLTVLASSPYHDPNALFAHMLAGSSATLFIEHKLLYPLELELPSGERLADALASSEGTPGYPPTLRLAYAPRSDCRATLVAYGHAAHLARRVVERLALEQEDFVELLVPAQLSPLDAEPIVQSVHSTGRLVTFEEGSAGWSWGSELASTISVACFEDLERPVRVETSRREIIPGARRLESETLISEGQLQRALLEILA